MSSPDLTDSERKAVFDVLNTPVLSMGSWNKSFENAFTEFTGLHYAIGVNSGTAGLHLCVRAAGIGPGDVVLTTPFSFVASTNVLLFENAIPVFVDVDPGSGNINPKMLAEAAQDLTAGGERAQKWLPRKGSASRRGMKAILGVDVFGQPADWDPIHEVAKKFGLKVIEDACEALGAEYKGRKVGSLGDYGVFAFYPNKQITTGEGGMVVTNDARAADMMYALRNQGRAPGDTWLSHSYLGYNYRLDEMSAALGAAQMLRVEELLRKREQVADWYGERLAEIPGVELPVVEKNTSRKSWFVYVVRFVSSLDRDGIARRLESMGVPVRPYFLPIHLQPYMVERYGFRGGDFPVTEDLGRRGLALPFSGVMTEGQVDIVCRAILKVMGKSN